LQAPTVRAILALVLSKEDNDLVCRVGPGTPMGRLMREYWLPAALSSELPGPMQW
jgi:phthalate 4,5-dioxygenase